MKICSIIIFDIFTFVIGRARSLENLRRYDHSGKYMCIYRSYQAEEYMRKGKRNFIVITIKRDVFIIELNTMLCIRMH